MKHQTPRATGPADDHAEGFIRTLLAGPNGRLSQAFENAWTSPHTSRVEANAERGVTRFLVDRSLPQASGRYELFSIRDQIRVVIEDLHASMYRAMGISPKLAYDIEQRPFYVTRDGHGKPIADLFKNAI